MPQAIIMTYIDITKFALINQLEKGHSMIETLFEKCCNFYPNNFKFCAVKKNYMVKTYSMTKNPLMHQWDYVFHTLIN